MAKFNSEEDRKGVELIAQFDDKHVVKDKETNEVKGKYAINIQTANWQYNKADIEAGKGQENPDLSHKGTNQKDHTQYLDKDTFEKIKEAGKGKAYTDEQGKTYIPFKADIDTTKRIPDKNADGTPHTYTASDGKERQTYTYRQDIKADTIQPSELPKLTEKRVEKQASNTEAIKETAQSAKSEAQAQSKTAKLEATAAKAEESKSVPAKSDDKSIEMG